MLCSLLWLSCRKNLPREGSTKEMTPEVSENTCTFETVFLFFPKTYVVGMLESHH